MVLKSLESVIRLSQVQVAMASEQLGLLLRDPYNMDGHQVRGLTSTVLPREEQTLPVDDILLLVRTLVQLRPP